MTPEEFRSLKLGDLVYSTREPAVYEVVSSHYAENESEDVRLDLKLLAGHTEDTCLSLYANGAWLYQPITKAIERCDPHTFAVFYAFKRSIREMLEKSPGA